MKTVLDIKNSFEQANIRLFSAVENSENFQEILFLGEDELHEFLDYMKMNNLQFAFYNHSEVTKESLVNLELITEEEFGIQVKKFEKEAEEYNKLVEKHMGELLSASIFTVHNSLLFKVVILSDLQDDIDEDGDNALSNITREYFYNVELYKLEREQEILKEIEEDQAEYKNQKIKKLYELLERDSYFSELTTKDGRILRATELANRIGLKETKTKIVGYLDLYMTQKKFGK